MAEYANNCIFVDHPQCSFDVSRLCRAPRFQVVVCGMNHRRLMLTKSGKNLLLSTFKLEVVEAASRVKSVQGQRGRDLLANEILRVAKIGFPDYNWPMLEDERG